jgi:hypothetical protein
MDDVTILLNAGNQLAIAISGISGQYTTEIIIVA